MMTRCMLHPHRFALILLFYLTLILTLEHQLLSITASLSPPSFKLTPAEANSGCHPTQIHTDDGHHNSTSSSSSSIVIQHLYLVNTYHRPHHSSIPPSFLFRGASPVWDHDHDGKVASQPPSSSRFLYRDLLANMRRVAASTKGAPPFPENDEDVFLIDISLLQPNHEEDGARINAEQEWFNAHDRLYSPGRFILWPMDGSADNVTLSSRHAVSQSSMTSPDDGIARRMSKLKRSLRHGHVPNDWAMPDDLLTRLHQLKSWLEGLTVVDESLHNHQHHRRQRTVVLFVHCFCGSDRTGELMGSWNMWYSNLKWKQAQQTNTFIAKRPMGCGNYLAMQWMCLYLEGQRNESLGCMQNFPCTHFG